MTGWATTFLIFALVAATLAFGGVPGPAVSIARALFIVAAVAALVTGCFAFFRHRAHR